MLERIRDGRTDLVRDYLAAGFAADAVDDDGVPLIRWCAYYGDVSAVRCLLAEGAPPDLLGKNLDLHAAAFHGHWQLCEFLIEQGANPNHRQAGTGETPLHAALSRATGPRQHAVVQVLLAGEADPNIAAEQGAATGCFMRDVRTKGETPLHRAAAFASVETISSLLDAGGARDRRDAHGDTPLSWASWHLRPAAIIRMLCHGDFAIHPDARWTGDHGAGTSGMDLHLIGKPSAG